jgi:hypothetical protein
MEQDDVELQEKGCISKEGRLGGGFWPEDQHVEDKADI